MVEDPYSVGANRASRSIRTAYLTTRSPASQSQPEVIAGERDRSTPPTTGGGLPAGLIITMEDPGTGANIDDPDLVVTYSPFLTAPASACPACTTPPADLVKLVAG